MKMPEPVVLRQSLRARHSKYKQDILDEFSGKQQKMEGMLNVEGTKLKQNSLKGDEKQPVYEYLSNFSKTSMLFTKQSKTSEAAAGFARQVSLNFTGNFIKQKFKREVLEKMKAAEKRRLQNQSNQRNVVRKKSIFETFLVRSLLNNERTLGFNQNCLQKVANSVEAHFHYNQRYKQRDMIQNLGSHAINISAEEDPRIQYMKKCEENTDSILPILDKVVNKTICLQNYLLSEGHVQGLAKACEHLDPRIVNRMLFNNCGMSADNFAQILTGIAKMQDFKSLIYKQGALNQNSIERMSAIFKTKLPYHFEELSLIDCRISPSLICLLMEQLLTSRVKKLALVNLQHSEKSFDSVIGFVQQSCYLRELDLRWSNVRPSIMLRLLKKINENSSLVSLSLAFNGLLEDQQLTLTPEQIESGQTEVELSDFNLEVVSCFKEFIKYNVYLYHLDLTMTGLNAPAIKYLCSLLRKSQALSCLHLCGNKGLTEELFQWVTERIHGLRPPARFNVPQSKTEYQEPPEQKSAFSALLEIRKNNGTVKQKDNGGTSIKQRAVREGIKLRNIKNTVQMNELGPSYCNQILQRLLIQRTMGFKELLPGSAQWRVYTSPYDECRHCNQSVLTVFLWNPRLGQLNGIQDPTTLRHYKRVLEEKKAKLSANELPSPNEPNPIIYGPFTGWRPQKMANLFQLLSQIDHYKPDFVKQAIQEGLVKQPALQNLDNPYEKMSEKEKDKIGQLEEDHYNKHWHQLILPMLQYRFPHVANEDNLPLAQLKITKDNPLFFHVEFVKPGRSTFVIQQNAKQVNETTAALNSMLPNHKNLEQNEPRPSKTYVHQTMSPIRIEPHFQYFNPRHVRLVKTDVTETQDMFIEWQEDTQEIRKKVMMADFAATIKVLLEDIDNLESSRVQTELFESMPIFLDIFHYLQSISESYPLIDFQLITTDVLDLLENVEKNAFHEEKLENMIIETCIQNEHLGIRQFRGKYKLNRALLLEVFFRWAVFLFGDKYIKKEEKKAQKGRNTKTYQPKTQQDDNMTYSQALFLFLKDILKPYHKKLMFRWQAFRDEELWCNPSQKVFTNNQTGIRKLFKKYSKDSKFLTFADCKKMVCDDSDLDAPEEVVLAAFALSKQTVVNEQDDSAEKFYNQMPFVEFCEFLARLVDKTFKGSEMEELPLEEKLEYILEDLLPLADQSFVQNKTTVKEFSDSDEDY